MQACAHTWSVDKTGFFLSHVVEVLYPLQKGSIYNCLLQLQGSWWCLPRVKSHICIWLKASDCSDSCLFPPLSCLIHALGGTAWPLCACSGLCSALVSRGTLCWDPNLHQVLKWALLITTISQTAELAGLQYKDLGSPVTLLIMSFSVLVYLKILCLSISVVRYHLFLWKCVIRRSLLTPD